MWELIFGRLPGKLIIVNTFLAFAIPFTIYKIYDKFHKAADPPWKKKK